MRAPSTMPEPAVRCAQLHARSQQHARDGKPAACPCVQVGSTEAYSAGSSPAKSNGTQHALLGHTQRQVPAHWTGYQQKLCEGGRLCIRAEHSAPQGACAQESHLPPTCLFHCSSLLGRWRHLLLCCLSRCALCQVLLVPLALCAQSGLGVTE